MMITLLTPGRSAYSVTALDHCDEKCQQAPTCDEPTLACGKPVFSNEVFNEHMKGSKGLKGAKLSAFRDAARLKSWTVMESYKDAMERYVTIAKAIDEIGSTMVWTGGEVMGVKCTWNARFHSNKKIAEGCKHLMKARPWMGNRGDLEKLLLTTIKYESGFRKDIHSGIGTHSKGDCRYRFADGSRAAPGAKGARRVPGSCRSACLAQLNLGTGKDPYYGYRAKDVVGTDFESTKRCLMVATRMLSNAQQMCRGPSHPQYNDWAHATMTAYGTGGRCSLPKHRGLRLRAKTFWELKKKAHTLNPRAKTTLITLGFLPRPKNDAISGLSIFSLGSSAASEGAKVE